MHAVSIEGVFIFTFVAFSRDPCSVEFVAFAQPTRQPVLRFRIVDIIEEQKEDCRQLFESHGRIDGEIEATKAINHLRAGTLYFLLGFVCIEAADMPAGITA